MHICSRHLYPGEVRWGRLEAECRVEDQVAIVDCRHRVIFFSAASLAILWPVLVDEAAVAGRRLQWRVTCHSAIPARSERLNGLDVWMQRHRSIELVRPCPRLANVSRLTLHHPLLRIPGLLVLSLPLLRANIVDIRLFAPQRSPNLLLTVLMSSRSHRENPSLKARHHLPLDPRLTQRPAPLRPPHERPGLLDAKKHLLDPSPPAPTPIADTRRVDDALHTRRVPGEPFPARLHGHVHDQLVPGLVAGQDVGNFLVWDAMHGRVVRKTALLGVCVAGEFHGVARGEDAVVGWGGIAVVVVVVVAGLAR